MNIEPVLIPARGHSIPGLLWGGPSNKLMIAVHGFMGNKADEPINVLAEIAADKGYRVLSFDLPEHGDRFGENYVLDPENSIGDLEAVYRYAQENAQEIALFGCSMGAYLSLISYPSICFNQVIFLSPLVNMEAMIRGMMTANHVTDEQLEREKVIEVPNQPPLIFNYLQQVLRHPVDPKWTCPVNILYGSDDSMVPWILVSDFVEHYHANVHVMEQGEHYFHTEEQMKVYCEWLVRVIN